MPVDSTVDVVDNKTRAVELRARGLTLADIGLELGISKQGVAKLLATAAKPTSNLPLVKIEAASRTLAELAESTRAALAETFELGASRARRRIREVHAGDDDAAAKTVLETAKLATDGAARVHGWGETNQASSGRVAIQVIGDLRGLVKEKTVQEVDVEQVPTNSAVQDDLASHPKVPEQAENQ